MTDRNIFAELMEGMEALQQHREGKLTLRTHKIEHKAAGIEPDELRTVRERLNLSQAVFAGYLQAGETTYQNWEQGKAKPNRQAVLLIRMVEQNPDTLQTLARL